MKLFQKQYFQFILLLILQFIVFISCSLKFQGEWNLAGFFTNPYIWIFWLCYFIGRWLFKYIKKFPTNR